MHDENDNLSVLYSPLKEINPNYEKIFSPYRAVNTPGLDLGTSVMLQSGAL